MSYIYLASPYSKLDKSKAYAAAAQATVYLITKCNYNVYSPIVHCHNLARDFHLQGDFTFWKSLNYAMLHPADELFALTLPGWLDSEGLQDEIAAARTWRKPVKLLNVTYDLIHDHDSYQIVDYSIPA